MIANAEYPDVVYMPVVWIGILVLVFLICLELAFRYWVDSIINKRIRKWADSNEYALLRVEYRRFCWGLLSFIPIVNTGQWRVKIQDAEGGQRHAWVYFGWWWLDIPWGKLQVRWQ